MTPSRKTAPRDLGTVKPGLSKTGNIENSPTDISGATSGTALASTEGETSFKKQAWNSIADDLKHSANLWDILEIRTSDKETNRMNEVRKELQRLKIILEKNNF